MTVFQSIFYISCIHYYDKYIFVLFIACHYVSLREDLLALYLCSTEKTCLLPIVVIRAETSMTKDTIKVPKEPKSLNLYHKLDF